jgi:hypothetical protein
MINPRGYCQVPLDPNLVGWFEADKINNVNTALPSNGGAVANWFDISGKGSIITQGTAANQPSFSTNVVNGKPAVTFNSNAGGANGDSLTSNNATYLSNLNLANAATGFTIFVCAQIDALTPPSTQSGCILFMQGSSPSSNEIYQISQTSTGAITNSVSTSSAIQRIVTSGNAVVNTPFINSFWWDKANSSIAGQFNSNTIVAGSGSVPALNTGPILFAIGQQKAGQPTRQFDGKIFAILIYSRFLSSTERQYVKQYLGSKYGVTV